MPAPDHHDVLQTLGGGSRQQVASLLAARCTQRPSLPHACPCVTLTQCPLGFGLGLDCRCCPHAGLEPPSPAPPSSHLQDGVSGLATAGALALAWKSELLCRIRGATGQACVVARASPAPMRCAAPRE
eukprot:655545-Rhodomonas_salina.1